MQTLSDLLAQISAATPPRMPVPQIDLRAQRAQPGPVPSLTGLLSQLYGAPPQGASPVLPASFAGGVPDMTGGAQPALGLPSFAGLAPQAPTNPMQIAQASAFGSAPQDMSSGTGGGVGDVLAAGSRGMRALPAWLNTPIGDFFGGSAPATPPAAAPQPNYRWDATAGGAAKPQTITINADGTIATGTGGSAAGGDPISNYMGKMYGAESRGGQMIPNQAGASSAFGPAQFTNGTWVDTVRQYDKETYNALGGDENKILALRKDAPYHRQMAEAFTRGNAELLPPGVAPTDASLYTMHFFGRGDGPKVLSAPDNTPLASVVRKESIEANPHLQGMTVGQAKAWAANAINKGGGSTAGGAPTAPTFTAPQLPDAPVAIPGAQFDTSAYDAYGKNAPTRLERIPVGDRIGSMLAAMAGGASGAKTLGDVLTGAAGGAGAAAARTQGMERQEDLRLNEAQRAFQDRLAQVGVQKAGAQQANANIPIATQNTNAMRQFEVKTAQAQADAATKQLTQSTGFKYDLELFEKGMSHFVPNKDGEGYTIYRQDPRTGQVTLTQAGGMGKSLQQLGAQSKAVEEVFGDKAHVLTAPLMEMGVNKLAAQYGVTPEYVAKMAIRHDLSTNPQLLSSILPADDYKKLTAEVDKNIPVSAKSSQTEYPKAQQAGILQLLTSMQMKDPAKWDKLLIEGAAKNGNIMAQRLMRGGG